MAGESIQLGEAGVDVAIERPRVVIWAEYVLLDETGTRQLAALLLAAADRLEAITGA